MSFKVPNPQNEEEEIEVFTADEIAARETAVRTETEGKFTPQITDLNTKLTAAEKAASIRAGEFKQFRELSEKQLEELSEKDRIIYNNGLALKKAEDDRVAGENGRIEEIKKSTIASKVGKDEKLAAKILESWDIVNIVATTPEQIEQKTMAILGMFSTTQPDLVASVQGFGGGSFEPPKPKAAGDGESFADTAVGKAGASELGLLTEAPKAK